MLNLEEIENVLLTLKVDKEIQKKIIAEAAALEEEKRALKEGGKKKNKSQFVVVQKGSGEDTVSHIFQLAADVDPITLIDKVKQAAISHNIGQKRKKNMVNQFDDLIHIKRKYSKESGYLLKTKDWVRTIILIPEMEVIAPPINPD